ncbi:MAG TPA: cupin domain-containing protein [Candidatus Nanoarchaeia archaeon]|nr:cupin domain-containing protein [Candidatus Nanoarchaeia archaeon]
MGGDFFSVQGSAKIISNGLGIVNSSKNFEGFNIFGGPIEEKGKLKYIDGCTDTLLVPPVRKGDPCLNYLHFPLKVVQTPHTHPSVRTGMIYKGEGECILPEENKIIPLIHGNAFVIKTNTVHSFNTTHLAMDVIAYHPDSDVGMTDVDHPMINRTIINGISASKINDKQTR